MGVCGVKKEYIPSLGPFINDVKEMHEDGYKDNFTMDITKCLRMVQGQLIWTAKLVA